ncbi:MAG: C39 family peptidase [Candidatus Sabulitectum sp.]|nr:C39 family peptidase [Candidatus Sabulitectum sp.]
MLLFCILAALRISAGFHGSQEVSTDLSGSVLFLGSEIISSEPGSGGNVLSSDSDLFWKECPPGSHQRIVSLGQGEIFSLEYFSGPFSFGDEIMVSVPDEILILDQQGTFQRSYSTGEYPGSLCSDGENIWFVSSRDGVLKKINTRTSIRNTVNLSFTPVSVQYGNDFLLIGNTDGGYSIVTAAGDELLTIQEGFMGFFSGSNTVTFTRSREFEGCETLSWETVSVDIRTGMETVVSVQPGNASLVSSLPTDDPTAHFDVPYMHQRWDTPDWFDGSWSCGPTSCMMAVQYYNRLTPDSVWCSYPSGHWSEWGNYLPTEYTFLGYTYDILGVSPDSVWVPGAHGFICRDIGGAIWAEMTSWMTQHELDSGTLGTTWSACTGELDNSYAVVASTTSPYTGGHILLFNGYYDNHSVICNDSYGNQNLPGWGTLPNGKDVVYDWPGYNNGNTQLGVSQLFSARSEILSPAGELIDDRSLGYRKLGPCQYWHEQETGYNGYSWWTYSTGALPDTCFAEWIPELPSETWYLVETYVPSSHSTATGIYHINSSTGWVTATVNQGNYSDQWAAVGSFFLSPSSAKVRMGDYTGTQSQHISFDAIRFTQQTSIDEQSHASESECFTISQNPVHTASPIVFNLPDGFNGTIQIYDLTGRLALTVQSSIPAGSLAPGLYHAILYKEDKYDAVRFTVVN